MVNPLFVLKYGKIVEVDVHGLGLEDARAEVLYYLNTVDVDVKGFLVVHGYHKGTATKNWIRNEFADPRVIKIINAQAGATLLLLSENLAIK